MDNIFIPVEQYPDQTMRMELEGKPVTIRIYWSAFDESVKSLAADDGWTPEGCWYMDISNDEFAAYGVAITGGCDILRPLAQQSLGGLFVVSVEPESQEITFDTFGVQHLLLYVVKENYDEFVQDVGWSR